MPRCRACHDPRRNEIDRLIISGRPLRAISADVGIGLGSLCRHKQHIKELLGATLETRTPSESERHASALLQRVLRLADEAENVLRSARARSDFRGANGALGASAKLLDLCGRLSGELTSSHTPGDQPEFLYHGE
jgi:hypothetical protein